MTSQDTSDTPCSNCPVSGCPLSPVPDLVKAYRASPRCESQTVRDAWAADQKRRRDERKTRVRAVTGAPGPGGIPVNPGTWAPPPAVPDVPADNPGECPECGQPGRWTPRQTGVTCPAGHWSLTVRSRAAAAAGDESRALALAVPAAPGIQERVELKAAVIADIRALDETARYLEEVERAGHWQHSAEAGSFLAVLLALRSELSTGMSRAEWQEAHAAVDGLKSELQVRGAAFDSAIALPPAAAPPPPRAIDPVSPPAAPRAAAVTAASGYERAAENLRAQFAMSRAVNLDHYGPCEYCIRRGENPEAAQRRSDHEGWSAWHCRRRRCRKDALADLKAAAAAPPPPDQAPSSPWPDYG